MRSREGSPTCFRGVSSGGIKTREATYVWNKVFKGESVRRDVFVFVRQGVSFEALRRKLFEPHII